MGSFLNKVAQTALALIASQCIIAQTLVLQSGASINTTGNIPLVVQNGNVINNGAFLGTGKLLLTGTSAANISGTGTISNLELNNTAGATITSGSGNMTSLTGTLTITNGILTTSGNLTLKSDAINTANVAPITSGSISGNVIVERYNSNKRAWRLLGIPFSASAQTIRNSWMENGSSAAGFGTQITTFNGDPNAGSFDAQKPSSSIRTYTANNFNSDGTHTPNTTNLITATPAYFLFVRGDRSVDRTTVGAPSGTTVLRATGTLRQGPLTGYGVTGSNFSLIPNPYPSPIDFDAVKAANSSITKFYVWDATLAGTNGVGQYRTIDITGTAPNYTYTATPGTASNSWRYIESGTAFFIPGNATINFTEAMKTAGIPPSSMLRVTGNEIQLIVNLNVVNTDNTTSLADGVREVFDNNYSATIDNNDAKKIAGFELNFGISSNNEILAIEKRPLPTANEAITLSLSNMAQGNYQFELQAANLPAGLTPYLKDNYLGTYIPISLSADTKINFTVTADAASSSQSRFSIVFNKPNINLQPSIVVYPNPVNNGTVTLQINNMPKGIYGVRLLNSLGQIILSTQINHAEGSSVEIFSVNKVKGIYMLEVARPDNTKQSNKIIIN